MKDVKIWAGDRENEREILWKWKLHRLLLYNDLVFCNDSETICSNTKKKGSESQFRLKHGDGAGREEAEDQYMKLVRMGAMVVCFVV